MAQVVPFSVINWSPFRLTKTPERRRDCRGGRWVVRVGTLSVVERDVLAAGGRQPAAGGDHVPTGDDGRWGAGCR